MGYYRWRQGEGDISQYLRHVAEKEEKMDLPGAARTRWLGDLFGSYSQRPGAPTAQETNGRLRGRSFERLKEFELRWFAYFTRRWLRRTLQ